MADDPGPSWAKALDIRMLAMFGGSQRTRSEYDALLGQAGFRLDRVIDLGGDLAITISVGYASLSQANFESAEKMFEAADFALYSAKQAGRNRVMGFRERRSEDAAVAGEDAAEAFLGSLTIPAPVPTTTAPAAGSEPSDTA